MLARFKATYSDLKPVSVLRCSFFSTKRLPMTTKNIPSLYPYALQTLVARDSFWLGGNVCFRISEIALHICNSDLIEEEKRLRKNWDGGKKQRKLEPRTIAMGPWRFSGDLQLGGFPVWALPSSAGGRPIALIHSNAQQPPAFLARGFLFCQLTKLLRQDWNELQMSKRTPSSPFQKKNPN